MGKWFLIIWIAGAPVMWVAVLVWMRWVEESDGSTVDFDKTMELVLPATFIAVVWPFALSMALLQGLALALACAVFALQDRLRQRAP